MPPRMHQWVSEFKSLFFIFTTISSGALALYLSTEYKQPWVTLLAFLIWSVFLTTIIIVSVTPYRSYFTAADKLESELDSRAGTTDSATRPRILIEEIENSIERERVAMLRAKARADRLFTLGTTFLLLSIFGPILAAGLYSYMDPLSVATVERLTELHRTIGDALNLEPPPLQRDWHILAAGLSFGFLFLAAAGGLLRQQAREYRTYFLIGEKINRYQRLASIVRVRLAPAAIDEPLGFEEIINLSEDTLLRLGSSTDAVAESDELKPSTSSIQALADQTGKVLR